MKFNTIVEETLNELALPFTAKWSKEKVTKERLSKKSKGWEEVTAGKNKFLRYDDGKDTMLELSKTDGKWIVSLTKGPDTQTVKKVELEKFDDLKGVESYVSKHSKIGINRKNVEKHLK